MKLIIPNEYLAAENDAAAKIRAWYAEAILFI